jgi:lysophospholipase L1-like esterase
MGIIATRKAFRMRHDIRSRLIAGLLAATLCGICGAPIPAAAASANGAQCIVPPDLLRLDVPLERTARHLASSELIVIVALGSSSTAGAGASSDAASYPSRLAIELTLRFPSQPVKVVNHGVNGELAVDMLARFDKSVAAEHPDLVLWQLGTNAILRGHDRWPSSLLIRDGIRRMKAIGADVILIDPQFAPKVLAKPDIEEMLELILAAARQEHVGLFHRFALMRHWYNVDALPFETIVSSDGLHMNDWSYDCLAKAMAGAIARSVRGQSGNGSE